MVFYEIKNTCFQKTPLSPFFKAFVLLVSTRKVRISYPDF